MKYIAIRSCLPVTYTGVKKLIQILSHFIFTHDCTTHPRTHNCPYVYKHIQNIEYINTHTKEYTKPKNTHRKENKRVYKHIRAHSNTHVNREWGLKRAIARKNTRVVPHVHKLKAIFSCYFTYFHETARTRLSHK